MLKAKVSSPFTGLCRARTARRVWPRPGARPTQETSHKNGQFFKFLAFLVAISLLRYSCDGTSIGRLNLSKHSKLEPPHENLICNPYYAYYAYRACITGILAWKFEYLLNLRPYLSETLPLKVSQPALSPASLSLSPSSLVSEITDFSKTDFEGH